MDPDRFQERFQRRMDRFERKMDRFGDRFGERFERWEHRRYRRNSPSKHLFGGFVFVTIGVLFLLGNMGLLDIDKVLRFWPGILIALGLFKLVESAGDYAHSSGIFWVVVGSLFLMGNLGILR